jgi:hypothetical protein
MKPLRVLAGAALALLLLPSCATRRETTAQKWLEARWIMEVLNSGEAGDRRLQVVRWTKPPSLVLHECTTPQREAVERAVGQITEAFQGRLALSFATNSAVPMAQGQIHVHFAPVEQWPDLSKKWHLPPLPGGQDGVFFVHWNDQFEIDAAVVLIREGLSPERLEHTALEELYQSFGPRNDSPFFPESVVYESGDDTGGQRYLSERDKTLLRFLYDHVPPGTRPDALAPLIDAHWPYGSIR